MMAATAENGSPSVARRNAKDAVSIFAIQVTGAVLLLCMHMVSTRLLPTEEYGKFNYALTLTNTLAILACLGFQTSLIRFVAEYRAKTRDDQLKGMLAFSLAAICCATLVISLILLAASTWAPASESLKTSLALAAMILPLVSIGVWRSMATRGLQQISRAILPEEIVRPACVILGLLLLGTAGYILTATLATTVFIVSGSISLALGLFFLYKSLPAGLAGTRPTYQRRQWTKTSFTMLSGTMSQEIVNRSDILLLGLLASVEASGIYSVALRLSLLNVFTLKIVDTLVAPKIAAAYFQNKPDELRQIVYLGMKVSALGALPVSMALFFFPDWALGFFGPAYAEGSTALQILVVGQFVNGLTGPVGHALLMTGNERKFTRIIATILPISICAQIVAIHLYEGIGAAGITATTTIAFNLALLATFLRTFARQSP